MMRECLYVARSVPAHSPRAFHGTHTVLAALGRTSTSGPYEARAKHKTNPLSVQQKSFAPAKSHAPAAGIQPCCSIQAALSLDIFTKGVLPLGDIAHSTSRHDSPLFH